MKPTAKTLESIYIMLCQMKPFKYWDLPNTAEIEFKVVNEEYAFGTYVYQDDIHKICISRANCSHFITIVKSLAHECIHMKRYKTKVWDKHDAIFRRYAKQIGDEFGIDPLEI